MSTTVRFSIIILVITWYIELAIINSMPANAKPNNRPIIAILSEKISHGLVPSRFKALSYIAASYVKYIESAGARVVPVTTTMSSQEIEDIFYSVNGVLLPGGAVSIFESKYATNTRHFFELATEANKRGDFFPVWGTCLGFEALACIVADEDVLSLTNAVDIAIPLNFSSDAKTSEMFRDAPDELMKKLSTEGLTYNYHYKCVTTETFHSTSALHTMFRALSYNTGKDGKTYISTMEGKDLPIYATQWHPERNSFEWFENRHIPHSKNAIDVTQYFANFFVNQARKSQHRFKSKEIEDRYLIYRYQPVYTGDAGHFEECYIFN